MRANAITVVITGEGADELFWGYDLFKEVALRELHRASPDRARELLDELYPYLGAGGARRGPAWSALPARAGRRDDPLASHLTPRRGDRRRQGLLPPRARRWLDADPSLDRLRERLPAGVRATGAGSSAPPGSR